MQLDIKMAASADATEKKRESKRMSVLAEEDGEWACIVDG